MICSIQPSTLHGGTPKGGLSCMLLHDWAVLRENWEVGLRPSHPHQLSGWRRSPAEQAAPSPKASPLAQGPPESVNHEDRAPGTMRGCPHLPPGRAGMGPSRSLQTCEDIPLACVHARVRALSLREAAGSRQEPGCWPGAGGHGKSPGTCF